MNPQLIKYARETETSIAMARREDHLKLFTLYPHLVINMKCPVNQEQVEPYKEVFGHRVILKCESISFKLQAPIGERESLCQIEPYYTSLCLFDAKNGRKLTENFHFDVNHPKARSLIIGNGVTQDICDFSKVELPPSLPKDWMSHPKQAILSVTNAHPDIFLVVRIEKVLQGGIYQATEPYIKVNKDQKFALKVYRNVDACCTRHGNYRMPFAWAARPLFRLSVLLDSVTYS